MTKKSCSGEEARIVQQVEGKRSARQKPPRKRFGKKILDHPSVPEPQVPRRRPSRGRRRGARGLKEQREQQDGGEQGPGASGCRAAAAAAAAPAPGPVGQVPAAACRSSAAARARRVRDPVIVVQRLLAARAPGALLVVVLLVVVVVQAPVRAAAALAIAQFGAEAQASHVFLDRLADGPFQAVAHAVVEQCRLGHGQHVLDDRAALVGAAQPVEELATVGQVAAKRQVAAAVAVTAPPGLGAAQNPARARAGAACAAAARPGQARLNGALGRLAVLVLRTVTVLQGGPATRVVELNEGRDAVARAAPARRKGGSRGREGGSCGGGPRHVAPAALRQHRRARLGVLVVGVAALRLPLALQQRLPADEAAAVRQPRAPRRRAQQLQQRHQAQPGARHGSPAGPAAAAQQPCDHRGQRRPPGEERKGDEARGAADAEPAEKFAPVLPTSCMRVFINPCAPPAVAPLLAEGRLSLGLRGLPRSARPWRAPPVGPRQWREAFTAALGGCWPRGRGGAAGPRGAAGAFCSAPADPLCGRGGSFLPDSVPRRRRGFSHRAASWLASGRCPPSRGPAARVPSPSARGDPGLGSGELFPGGTVKTGNSARRESSGSRASLGGAEEFLSPKKETPGQLQAPSSFWSHAFSQRFAWHVVWLSVIQLWHYLFIGTLNSLLNNLASKDSALVSTYTNAFAVTQFFGVLCAPWNGLLMDRLKHKYQEEAKKTGAPAEAAALRSAVPSLALTSLLCLGFAVCASVPVLPLQYATFILQVVSRSFLYGCNAAFLTLAFPSEHFGKLFGLVMALSAAVSLLQFPLFTLIKGPLQDDPLYVNLMLMLLTLLTFIHPFRVDRECQRKESPGEVT